MKENHSVPKKFRLGQYFTKKNIVRRVVKLIEDYKKYPSDIKVLEPSSGTGNFVSILGNKFSNITSCEIDPELTENPVDFFEYSLENKFDLIIGNPPFSKYNVKSSYYFPHKYVHSSVKPDKYLIKKIQQKEKEKIENVFILKALKHLRNKDSTLAFVLPISFFIKNKNKEIKEELLKKFSTVIIYQSNTPWFEENIPCCFAIFTNVAKLKNAIHVLYEGNDSQISEFDISNIHEELIPEVIYHKTIGHELTGERLEKYLSTKRVKYNKSFKNNNVSAKNILKRIQIPKNGVVEDYRLAVTRVGNSSVGKCGLIDIKNDVLNDMFYVFDFVELLQNDKELKEHICKEINANQDYFKKRTCRVGSKSIKKEDVYEFKVTL